MAGARYTLAVDGEKVKKRKPEQGKYEQTADFIFHIVALCRAGEDSRKYFRPEDTCTECQTRIRLAELHQQEGQRVCYHRISIADDRIADIKKPSAGGEMSTRNGKTDR